MCGRFTLTADGEALQMALGLVDVPTERNPRFNIAPSQSVAVVTNQQPNKLSYLQWGLIPSWAKDPAIANRLINARSETAHEKPSFRDALRLRRCLIPANGWFEWQVTNKKDKMPTYLHLPDHEVFAFAGLWEMWRSPEGKTVGSCTILTTDASESVQNIHHRMPVILERNDYDRWLKGDNPADYQRLFKPYTAQTVSTYPVSTRVNKPANDSPENIVPFWDAGGHQLPLF